MAICVTQRAEFECCYVLRGELNAHRYKIEVTVDGPQREEDYGYVIEFSKLNKYLKSVLPDKTFLYDSTTQNFGREVAFLLAQHGIPVRPCTDKLSAETICFQIVESLQSELNDKEPGVRIISAKLRENSESFVSWDMPIPNSIN